MKPESLIDIKVLQSLQFRATEYFHILYSSISIIVVIRFFVVLEKLHNTLGKPFFAIECF